MVACLSLLPFALLALLPFTSHFSPSPSTASASTAIILPLYFQPSSIASQGGCYQELRDVAKLHPKLEIVVVIKPVSGGPTLNAENEMLRCIPRLKAECPRCLFLGWVDAPTSRSEVQVKRDIAKYRDYASLKVNIPGSAKTATVAVDGIFFASVSPANVNAGKNTAFSQEVHTAFRSGGIAVLNPGEDVPKSFYSNANLVITYDGTYRAYAPPKNNAASFFQQIVIIHSFPTKFVDGLSPTQRLLPLLDDLVLKKQVAAVFVSDFQSDLGFAFNWKAFAAAVAWRNQKVENSAKKERREVVFAELKEA